MKKSSKGLSMMLVLVMLLAAFAGCQSAAPPAPAASAGGDSAAAAPADGSAPAEGGAPLAGKKVVLITSSKTYDGQEDAYNAAAQQFSADTGCDFSITYQGKWTDLIQTLQAAQISGEQYEMTSVGSGNLHQSVAKSGLVMDITEIVKPLEDRFYGDGLSQHTIGGHVFGIPHGSVSTMGMFYNKTLLDELGLEIKDGYTYDEFKTICETIKAKKGISPMAQNGASWWWWPSWFFMTYAQETGNQSVAEIESWLKGEKSFVDEKTVAAFNDIKTFFDDGLISTDSLQTDDDAMAADFLQRNCAFIYCTATNYVKFADADFEIGFTTVPVIADGAVPQSPGGADEGLNVLTLCDDSNLDAVAAVLEYFTRPEVAGPMFEPVQNFGYSINGVEGAATPVSDKAMELFTNNNVTYLDWYWSAEHNDAVVAAIQALVTGDMDAAQAAESVQAAYDKSVKENDYTYNWWDSWTQEDWAKVTPAHIPAITAG